MTCISDLTPSSRLRVFVAEYVLQNIPAEQQRQDRTNDRHYDSAENIGHEEKNEYDESISFQSIVCSRRLIRQHPIDYSAPIKRGNGYHIKYCESDVDDYTKT